jgi:pimeloyl-ACP methyl ester carboxylesterase
MLSSIRPAGATWAWTAFARGAASEAARNVRLVTISVLYRALRPAATYRDLGFMSEARQVRRGRSWFTSLVQVVGLGLLGYAAVMFFAQRRMAFPGTSRESARTTASAPAGVAQVWLEPSFGRVEAWFFESDGDGPEPTVVFAHGNGELIEDWQDEMEGLRRAGVNALLVEFPGYGFSEGEPSREALREAFAEAFDWLVEDAHVAPERFVAYGRSIGGGAAADLAIDRPVGALALQSTFTSTAAMAREMLLPGFLVRDRFDNRRAVADFSGPVLLLHGLDDDVISYSHALGLAGARDGLEVVDIDCAHNDCGPEWPGIVSTLTDFLALHGLLDRSVGRGSG